jgi:hypothetical protein
MGVSRWLPDIIAGPRGRSALALAVYYWSFHDWYLDSVNGSDTNSGTTAGTSLRTAEELSRRLAVSVPIDHPVTVHMAPGAYGTLAVSVIQSALACPFNVVGTPTYTDIGTVTSYTDRVVATNTAAHLAATGAADWTPYVGRRVDVLSGASAGAVAWVAKANPHALGLGVARVSRFSLRTGENIQPGAQVPLAGSALSVAVLPSIATVAISQRGTLTGDSFFTNRGARIQNVDVGVAYLVGNGPVTLDGAKVSKVVFGQVYTQNTQIALRCFVNSDESYPVIGDGVYSYCLLGGTVAASYTTRGNVNLTNCLSQGKSLSLLSGSAINVGVFDAPSVAVVALKSETGRAYVSGCYGRDNAGGLSLPTNTAIAYATANTITGAAGDVQLVGAGVYIPHSAVPWVDGERSGEVALVAGTKQVTVPYVLASQTIMATCKTPGGTIGFLRAFYVNSTTIQIDSLTAAGTLNNLDTSTVTWRINATGDNAVIRS